MRHTGSDGLSTALDHGAYTANGIASYVSSSSDAAGQHAHGSILDVIRDEARHFGFMRLGIEDSKEQQKGKAQEMIEALERSKGKEEQKAQTGQIMMERSKNPDPSSFARRASLCIFIPCNSSRKPGREGW
jgi:hypothetical protein